MNELMREWLAKVEAGEDTSDLRFFPIDDTVAVDVMRRAHTAGMLNPHPTGWAGTPLLSRLLVVTLVKEALGEPSDD